MTNGLPSSRWVSSIATVWENIESNNSMKNTTPKIIWLTHNSNSKPRHNYIHKEINIPLTLRAYLWLTSCLYVWIVFHSQYINMIICPHLLGCQHYFVIRFLYGYNCPPHPSPQELQQVMRCSAEIWALWLYLIQNRSLIDSTAPNAYI